MAPENIKKIFQKHNFIFTGSTTGKELNQIFKKSTIALCPVMEGSGMKVKILNYCSAGLPTITTQIGSSGYEKITSLIIENDLKKYAKIIINLLSNPKKMRSIGRKNRILIKKYYNLDMIVDKTIQTYKDILNKFPDNKAGLKIKKKIELPLPLWLQENRITKNRNKNYYLIKNGKIIFKKQVNKIT